MRFRCLTVFLFFYSLQVFTQTLEVNIEELSYAGKYMSFYIDPTRKVNIETIASLDSNQYTRSKSDFPKFGVSKSAVWIKINVLNHTGKRCYIRFINTRLDTVFLYSQQNASDDNFKFNSSGYNIPAKTRDFFTPTILFELPYSDDNLPHTYYIRITSHEGLNATAQIGSVEKVMNSVLINSILDALYFGILIVMVLYNLFLLVSTRSKSYIFYILFMLSMGFYLFFVKGYTIYLPDELKNAIYQYNVILVAFIEAFAALFAIAFLDIRNLSKKLFYYLVFLIAFNVPIVIIELMGLLGTNSLVQNLQIIVSASSLVCIAIYAIIKKRPGAWFYLISWFSLLISVVVYIFMIMGLLPDSPYISHIIPIGSTVETILLSLALADRINILGKENERILKKSLEDSNSYNEELSQREEELASSEEELRVANDALSEANIHLEALLLAEKNLNEQLTKNEDEIRKQTTELIESNKKTSEYKLMALRSVMNPHFLFNSLNSIQYFIINNDREPALNYLSTFSKLIRAILDSSIQSSNVLSNEINLLKLYVSLETLRFDQKFTTIFTIDESLEIENIEIPTLILQPYVENAILHGLYNKLETTEGQLTIEFKNNGNDLICIVEDNGVGREEAKKIREASRLHKSVGMMVTQERLDLINKNNDLSVKITDLRDGNGLPKGTRVEVTILKY